MGDNMTKPIFSQQNSELDNSDFYYEEAVKHFAGSGVFFKTFDETISLVQLASDYLEGPGRNDQEKLSDKSSIYFATESVKLTNRLMQVSSWLLAHRAFYKGELPYIKQVTLDEMSEKMQIDSLDTILSHLPVRMAVLITQSHHLYSRIVRLDRQLKNCARTQSNSRKPSIQSQLADIMQHFSTVHLTQQNDILQV
jgi:hypothetical protein